MAFLTKKPRTVTIIAYKDNTAVISFQINTYKTANSAEFPLTKLYENISLDLAKKLDIINRK